TPPASTSSTSATIAWTTNATKVTCSLDGAPAMPCSSPATSTSLALGTHTFRVSGTREHTVRSISPSWTVTPPPAPATTTPTTVASSGSTAATGSGGSSSTSSSSSSSSG